MTTMNDVNYEIKGDNWASAKPLGNVYPDFQGRAVSLKNGNGFVIVDETGWNGYEEYPPAVLENEGSFASEQEAMERIYQLRAEYE